MAHDFNENTIEKKKKHRKMEVYPLVMTNIAMVSMVIEIDGLPFLKMVIFHGYVK